MKAFLRDHYVFIWTQIVWWLGYALGGHNERRAQRIGNLYRLRSIAYNPPVSDGSLALSPAALVPKQGLTSGYRKGVE